jgi:nitroreductase
MKLSDEKPYRATSPFGPEMEISKCIQTRRSIRRYAPIPIDWEKLGQVLDAARHAPSAGNIFDWKVIIVAEPDHRKAIAEACLQQWWMTSAPIHLVVCAEPAKNERMYGKRGGEVYSVQDATIAATQMMLVAHDIGLATCWVGAFETRMLRRALNIPDEIMPIAVLTIGYPDEKVPRPPQPPLEDLAYFETWNNRIKNWAAHLRIYSEVVTRMVKKGAETVKAFSSRLKLP